MNNLITLEKNIILENIKDLINISVDENVSYLKRCEGIACNGQININGLFENQNGIEKSFNEYVEIDNLVPYDNIYSLDDFSIVVDDFEYALSDENLKMYIKLKINSFKEVETSFPAEEIQEVILEPEDSEKSYEEPMDREVALPFLSNFLDTKKYERSSTFFVYKGDFSLEEICQKYQLSMEQLKTNNKENLQVGDLINIPLNHE